MWEIQALNSSQHQNGDILVNNNTNSHNHNLHHTSSPTSMLPATLNMNGDPMHTDMKISNEDTDCSQQTIVNESDMNNLMPIDISTNHYVNCEYSYS